MPPTTAGDQPDSDSGKPAVSLLQADHPVYLVYVAPADDLPQIKLVQGLAYKPGKPVEDSMRSYYASLYRSGLQQYREGLFDTQLSRQLNKN